MTPYEQRSQAPDPNAALMKLVDEIERYGLWGNEDLVALLSALRENPQDEVSKQLLDDQLTPYRAADVIWPNPFLPLPLPGAVDGPFRFGRVAGLEDSFIGLTESELNFNVGIFGQAGFGKTVTITSLLVSIAEAKSNVIFWAFSKKEDYPGLAKLYPGRINVFYAI